MGSEEAQLKDLLGKQIEYYRQAVTLEKDLKALVEQSSFSKVSSNTGKKQLLMEKIQKTYDKLVPLLTRLRKSDGTFENSECEKLRQEAVSILQELQKLEAENLALINGSRKKMIEGLKQAKTAKQAAKSYKPSKSDRSRRVDTKR